MFDDDTGFNNVRYVKNVDLRTVLSEYKSHLSVDNIRDHNSSLDNQECFSTVLNCMILKGLRTLKTCKPLYYVNIPASNLVRLLYVPQ